MIPSRYSPVTYALFRIVFGVLWVIHGLQKYGVLGGDRVEVGSLLGLAGIVEIVAGTLITLGWFTRPAALVASGQMAVAFFVRHLPAAFLPIHNGGEPAVLFCFAFLYIASKGAGTWSLDEVKS